MPQSPPPSGVPSQEQLRLLQAQLRALATAVEWQRARWQAVADHGQRQLSTIDAPVPR